MSDNVGGNFGGTLPHKKRSLGVHFSDSGPTGTLDLVKHRSQDSLDENDPWRYVIFNAKYNAKTIRSTSRLYYGKFGMFYMECVTVRINYP